MCVGIIGINTIVKNNRDQASRLERDRLEQKINNLEEQLQEKEQENDENKNQANTENQESKYEDVVLEPQISAIEMYNRAVEENLHLAVNRLFNYYMAVYGTIENNYNNYSNKDMYEVADKFLNLLYRDIKDHGGLSDDLLQEQRAWVDYKLNNFDKNDYAGLYVYTMDRCRDFIEGYN